MWDIDVCSMAEELRSAWERIRGDMLNRPYSTKGKYTDNFKRAAIIVLDNGCDPSTYVHANLLRRAARLQQPGILHDVKALDTYHQHLDGSNDRRMLFLFTELKAIDNLMTLGNKTPDDIIDGGYDFSALTWWIFLRMCGRDASPYQVDAGRLLRLCPDIVKKFEDNSTVRELLKDLGHG